MEPMKNQHPVIDGDAQQVPGDGIEPGAAQVGAGKLVDAGPRAAFDAPDDSSPPDRVGSTSAASGQAISEPSGKFPFSLAGKLRLILSQHGRAFVVVAQHGGNAFALPVGSRQLDNLIRALGHEEGHSLRGSEINEANDFLTAKAEMAGVTRPVWYRVAPRPDGIELDVEDDANTRIVVTPGKVEIVRHGSETLFYRTPVSAAFVMPAPVGDLDLLKRYLNLHAVDQLLLVAWMSYTLAHPKLSTSKFPILVINGDQGTGKTSLCNHVIYLLIDPNVIGVQVFPGSAKDLAIASQNAHVLCFDNMRSFKVAMADILCIAATGGAITNRALYTDAEQHVHYLHVALVLNGIHHFITQPDLAQRCVPIRTLPLPSDKRRSEAAMLKALHTDLPVIFRGLLDLIAKVLQHVHDVDVADPERMVDFTRWLAAMEKVDGAPAGVYQEAYRDALRQAQLDSLMENILAASLIEFCDHIQGNTWSGTPAKLLDELNDLVSRGTTYSSEWPQNPIALSKRVNGLKASFLAQCIDIQFGRGKERMITIRRTGGSEHE